MEEAAEDSGRRVRTLLARYWWFLGILPLCGFLFVLVEQRTLSGFYPTFDTETDHHWTSETNVTHQVTSEINVTKQLTSEINNTHESKSTPKANQTNQLTSEPNTATERKEVPLEYDAANYSSFLEAWNASHYRQVHSKGLQ